MLGLLHPVAAREKLDYASAAEGERSLLEEVSRRPLPFALGGGGLQVVVYVRWVWRLHRVIVGHCNGMNVSSPVISSSRTIQPGSASAHQLAHPRPQKLVSWSPNSPLATTRNTTEPPSSTLASVSASSTICISPTTHQREAHGTTW